MEATLTFFPANLAAAAQHMDEAQTSQLFFKQAEAMANLHTIPPVKAPTLTECILVVSCEAVSQ